MFKRFQFNNLPIGWKYGATLILVFILFGISTTIVSTLLNDIGNDVEALERRGDRSIMLTEMGSLVRGKSIRIISYYEFQDSSLIDEYETRRDSFNTLEAEIKDNMDTPEQKQLFEEIVKNDKRMNDLFTEHIIPAVNSGNPESARLFVAQTNVLRTETVNLLEELRTIVNEERTLAVQNAKASQALTFNIQLISMLVSMVISGLIFYFISRLIANNLNKVVDVSNTIAAGDLSVHTIEYTGKDEIGKLAAAVNTMSTNLRTLIQQVSDVSETVSSQSEELTQAANEVKTGTEQIVSTMEELATGTETQASSASTLASIMNEFSTKVHEVNQNGEHVEQSSSEVLRLTTNGSKLMESSAEQMNVIHNVVQDAVQKVQGLDEHSQKISKLISVIKDIADQTNLLALNAAIEAARAGEHGKGFAVVADEVRKLAEQVATSVTDITSIVFTIQNESKVVTESLQGGYKEVEQGSNKIISTQETFSDIHTAVTEMVDNIQIVSGNLADIAVKSQSINTSIEEIASISEEAAAGVEETSASSEQISSSMQEVAGNSEQLAKLAENLNELVRKFKL